MSVKVPADKRLLVAWVVLVAITLLSLVIDRSADLLLAVMAVSLLGSYLSARRWPDR